MRPQTLVMLLLALGSGLGAMVLVQRYMNKSPEKVEGVRLLVAMQDIPAGTQLTDLNVTEVLYTGKPPEDAKRAEELEKVKGRIAAVKFQKDDVIREGKLGKPGDASSLAVMLKKRDNGELEKAVTVRVQTAGAAAGFIRPDSLVDVAVYIPASGNRPAILRTFLRKMRVIAVNSQMQSQNEVQPQGQTVEMVTFAATKNEAEKLTLAESTGQIKLTLRSAEDPDTEVGGVLNIDEILKGKQEPVATEKPAESDKLDPALVKTSAKPGLLDSIVSSFTAAAAKSETKAEPVPAAQPASQPETPSTKVEEPVVQAPHKKRWKLIHKDHLGNPVMEVVLDDDSKWVESLKGLGLLEPLEEGEDVAKSGKTPEKAKIPPPPKAAKKP